jgi:hypothetical protein
VRGVGPVGGASKKASKQRLAQTSTHSLHTHNKNNPCQSNGGLRVVRRHGWHTSTGRLEGWLAHFYR